MKTKGFGRQGWRNGNIGFRNVFIIFSVLSLISAICAIGVRDKCIGKV